MARLDRFAAALGSALAIVGLSGCSRESQQDSYVRAQALDLVQREDRSRKPTRIEDAILSADRKAICGHAKIGSRKHVPFIINYAKPLPEAGLFATVDLVLLVPRYRGAPLESETAQASRITSKCRDAGIALKVPN
ncbi:hypothetical protein CSW60_18900 [Caulobacter sp. X]|nr:hypothetical protein CSW60_18900 [Caulobacter sp. X]